MNIFDRILIKMISICMRISAIIFCVFFCISACTHNHGPVEFDKNPAQDRISFKGTADYIFGGPLILTGRMKKPEGDGPFPAVVLLHGCGGIQSKRDHRWADRLSMWGYVTLQLDSFSPRGISSVCTYSGSASADIIQKRIRDAYDAKRYLAELPFVDRNRIAVMGWSHGGWTTLESLFHDKEQPFRAAIAFYPYCSRKLTEINAPLLVLIGEVDDWTPAKRCIDMMPMQKTLSEVILKVYPDAFHGFDTLGANHDVSGSRGMHRLQYNPAADADSIIQVRNFLKKYLR